MDTTLQSYWTNATADPEIFALGVTNEIGKLIGDENIMVKKFYQSDELPFAGVLASLAYKQHIQKEDLKPGIYHMVTPEYRSKENFLAFVTKMNMTLGHMFQIVACEQQDYPRCFSVTSLF